LKEYIRDTCEDHLLLASSCEVASAFSSLVGILHLSRHIPHDQPVFSRNVCSMSQLVESTFTGSNIVPALDNRVAFTTNLFAKLQGDDKILRYGHFYSFYSHLEVVCIYLQCIYKIMIKMVFKLEIISKIVTF